MSIKERLLKMLGGISMEVHSQSLDAVKMIWYRKGVRDGMLKSPVRMSILPLPFTEAQLAGREYGEFITPAGFIGSVFGDGSVPAPSKFGYEQRAYYVNRADLKASIRTSDLVCHRPDKFDDAGNSNELVPVIVTVLR